MKFTRVVTINKTDVDAKGQGQRSKVKVTEVKANFAPFGHFQTIKSVWPTSGLFYSEQNMLIQYSVHEKHIYHDMQISWPDSDSPPVILSET